MGCAAPSPLHWKDLRATPQEIVLERPGVTSSPDGNCYHLRFLDRYYRVDPVAERVEELNRPEEKPLDQSLQILLIGYLIAPNGGEVSREEISEKELPGGPTFFRGPHRLPAYLVAERFGCDPDGFLNQGEKLGGTSVPLGDRAVRFLPLPSIPVTFVLWSADDEFDATVSVIFDRSIQRWFELDMVFLLVGEIVKRMIDD